MRVHAQRVATDMLSQDRMPGIPKHTDFVQAAHEVAMNGLKDPESLIQRCAVEALGNHRSAGTLRPLLDLLERVPSADTHLRYVVRKAIRDQLNEGSIFTAVLNGTWSDTDLHALAGVAVAVKSPLAGSFLLRNLARLDQDRASLSASLQHAARYAPSADLDSIAAFVREKFATDLDFQGALFASVEQGLAQSGAKVSEALREWGTEFCSRALAATPESAWWNTPLEGVNDPRNPWAFQVRACVDGRRARLLSSLPLGETLTGTLRSRTFALPAQLSFLLAGHQGEPTRPPHQRNVVLLRAADTGIVLAEAFPPRNDSAQKITWDLAEHAGKQGYLSDRRRRGGRVGLAGWPLRSAVLALPSRAPGDIARRQRRRGGRATPPSVAVTDPSDRAISGSTPMCGWRQPGLYRMWTVKPRQPCCRPR